MTTITLNIGTAVVPLALITEGNYSSEYFARTSTKEYRLKVRHTKEKASGSTPALDRHNLELSVRTFPTNDAPQGSLDVAYAVVRSNPNSDGATSIETADALGNLLLFNSTILVGWGSVIDGF